MVTVKEEEHIRQIQARLDKAKAKAKSQVARLQARARKRKRREDTRRKILVGEMYLGHVGDGGDFTVDGMIQNLHVYLTRPTDRQLFGLPPAPDEDGDGVDRAIANYHDLPKGTRAQQTQRKVLVGAWLLDHVASGKFPEKILNYIMDAFLVKDKDRALFDLPPRQIQQGRPAAAAGE